MASRFDPFREMDRLFADTQRSTTHAVLGMDLYRSGETFVAALDLPGVQADSIDIDVTDNVLTVRAERTGAPADVQWLSHERPTGTFARQLHLGRGLAVDKIAADYSDGVLTLTIPVAEEAKPRKISIGAASKSVESGV